MLTTMNPWGGVFRGFNQSLLNDAGMNIVIELTDAVVANAPPVDQRQIPDVDRYEECGEASVQCTSSAVGKPHSGLDVVNYLRGKYGESYVQHGTDMWELCEFLAHVGIPYVTHDAPIGDVFSSCLGRNRIAIGALWTAYDSAGNLLPVPQSRGGHIGHWEVSGALTPQVPAWQWGPGIQYQEDNMQAHVGQVTMGGGRGWTPVPPGVDSSKIVAVVVQDQAPDRVHQYIPIPAFAGVATDRGELVFGNGPDGNTPDGTYGFVVWSES